MSTHEANAAPDEDNRLYPNLERFIEQGDRAEIDALFDQSKQALSQLNGPRAVAAKKALAGIDQTQALLVTLMDIREQLTADAKSSPARRRRP